MTYSCDPKIINETLMESMKGQPCVITGSINTHGHHRCKRSKCRLDVPENVVPLDDFVNSAIEAGFESFCSSLKQILGEHWVLKSITNMGNSVGFYGNMQEIYDWLTDKEKAVYNGYKGQSHLTTTDYGKRGKRKYKWPSRKLPSVSFKQRRCSR